MPGRELKFLLRFASDVRGLERARKGMKRLALAEKEIAAGAKAVTASTTAAAASTKRFGAAATVAGAKATTAFSATLRAIRTVGIALASIGIGFGLGAVIGTTVKFGVAMSRVQAITGELERDLSGNLNPTFEAINDTVRRLGATTVFTAGQAAEGFGLLSLAGFDAGEAITAVASVLDLAVVGSIDLASSATIVANSIRAFGLSASDAGRVADVFAEVVSSANTNVTELGEAMKFVGPIAASLGVSIEETAAAIGVLSDAGLKGTLAGTGLRRVLIGLAKQTPQAEKALLKAGIQVDKLRDSIQGGGGLIAAFEQFEGRSLSAAQAVEVFGLRGGPAFLVLQRLTKEAGSLSQALLDVEGRAAEFAAIARDNLGGDLKLLRSVIEDVILGTGSLNDSFRSIVQTITGVISVFQGTLDPLDKNAAKYRELAETIKVVFTAVKALVAALILLKVLSVVSALGVAFTKVMAAVAGTTLAGARAMLAFNAALKASLIGIGLLVIGAVIAKFIQWNNEISAVDQQLKGVDTTLERTNKILERTNGLVGDAALEQLPGLRDGAKQLDSQFKALENTSKTLAGEIEALNEVAGRSGGLGAFFEVVGSKNLTVFQQITAVLKGSLPFFTIAGEANKFYAEGIEKTGDELEVVTEAQKKFNAELAKVQAIEDAKKAIDEISGALTRLGTKTDEISKTVSGFRGTAEKAFKELDINISDLEFGVGDQADLKRAIAKGLRGAKLDVVLPIELSTAEAEAIKAVTEATKLLADAKDAVAVAGAKELQVAQDIVESAQVGLVAANNSLTQAREAIQVRGEERKRLTELVTAQQDLTVANKEALKVQKAREAALKDFNKSTEKLLFDLENERNLIGLTTSERKDALLILELENKAKKAGIAPGNALIAQIVKLRKENEAAARADIAGALRNQIESFVNAGTDLATGFGSIFKNTLEGLSDEIVNFVETGEFNFRSFAQNILKQFIKLGVDLALAGVFQRIQGALTPPMADGGGGGVLGAITGGAAALAPGAAPMDGDGGVLAAIQAGTQTAEMCCQRQLLGTEDLGQRVTTKLGTEGEIAREQSATLAEGFRTVMGTLGTFLSTAFTAGFSLLSSVFTAATAAGSLVVAGAVAVGSAVVAGATFAGAVLVAGAVFIGNAILLVIQALQTVIAFFAAIPLFAGGGLVDRPKSFGVAPVGIFRNAQRFANGGVAGQDTIPALLSPGERVLTRAQNEEFERGGGGGVTQIFQFNITTPDVAGFERSEGQIGARMQQMLRRSGERNN